MKKRKLFASIFRAFIDHRDCNLLETAVLFLRKLENESNIVNANVATNRRVRDRTVLGLVVPYYETVILLFALQFTQSPSKPNRPSEHAKVSGSIGAGSCSDTQCWGRPS